MRIYGGVNPYESHRFGFGYIDTIKKQQAATDSRNPIAASNERNPSIQAYRQVMRIREAVQAIRPAMLEAQEIQVASPARATSAGALDIGTAGTPATLQSTEEINTTPTSYSTHGPEWTGASTAQVTISGEYDGSDGSDTIRFEVGQQGTHGQSNLRIEVYDSNNIEIDSITISKFDPIDQQYTLSNGLILTLGEGDLARGDTLTLDVSDSVGSAVNPDNPFNGTRADDPNLEPGLSVSDGSFQINGTTIDVNAGDTVNTVLDRITQSDAGVTATFDAATDKVLLTQKTPGAEQDIFLQNDTSGFLAAMKLDTATATPGEDLGSEDPLAEVERFSAVQSGSISVNGISIDIDVNTDSLSDVLERISASEAGVTANFDSVSQKVSLTVDDAASQLNLSGGGTNFFAAIGITEGSYESTQALIAAQQVNAVDISERIVDSIVEENSEKPWEIQSSAATSVNAADARILGTLVRNIADAMNTLFDDSAFEGSPGAFLEGVRSGIRTAVSETLGSQGFPYKTDFGVNIDFEKTDKGVFDFSPADQSRFESAASTPDGIAAVSNTLFGTDSNGLFNRLHASLTASASAFESQSDPTGLFLDVSI